ncbi:CinA family protein [Pseudotabrizicola sp.]|uniref:CinA family protein n=1 Tax=Pseudotabrizicola sp. TaxID=2939647 RepID=UPI00271E444E|nr:CinA family protein [Pseudotabrizicola sp.]MDO8885010.1 CinA family protein [Pseudotabrizicola sp.]
MSAELVLALAREKGIRIVTAESCTGGLIAATLTEVPGSSDVFDRGYVTYSNPAKQEMLWVQEKTLTAYGAVSEQVAYEMAENALFRSGVGLAVSVTGIAGPGGSEFKPEGRVCFGLAQALRDVHTETVEFGAIGRAKVRQATVNYALALLGSALRQIRA